MTERPVITVIGLMTGTSMDGVDAACIETDGVRVRRRGGLMEPFTPDERATLKDAVAAAREWGFEGPEPNIFAAAETIVHRRCFEAARTLAGRVGRVDAIGLHGQTVLHRQPSADEPGASRQLGDGEVFARAAGVPVVSDFRGADIAAGGQGAPLAPIYHAALLREAGLEPPLGVLNIGGVANLTWWSGDRTDGDLLADGLWGFDTGVGNAPVDEWVEAHTGSPYDVDGVLASKGRVRKDVLEILMADPYFAAPPPKSLDRHAFDLTPVEALSLEDGAATLTAFAVEGVAAALEHVPAPPHAIVVAGGGARNPTMTGMLRKRLACGVLLAPALGWNGDTLEAELMAYLAARTLFGLPITFPHTTGAPQPMTGGKVAQP